MAQAITPARVVELVRIAKELRTEEVQIILAAVGLQCAQDVACAMIEDEPYEYEGVSVYPGTDLWEQVPVFLEDIAAERELNNVVEKYQVASYFDIRLQREIVAKPVKV